MVSTNFAIADLDQLRSATIGELLSVVQGDSTVARGIDFRTKRRQSLFKYTCSSVG